MATGAADPRRGRTAGSISLETPVLYFYTDRPLTASVHVAFPKGTLTEWYPQANRTADDRPLAWDGTDSKLAWDGIEVRPGESLKLPQETKESRYYAARETDAAPLRVSFYDKDSGGMKAEQEKFLFYRGVGDFDMPLKVRAWGDRRFTVDWKGRKPGVMLLVQVYPDGVRFEPFLPDHATDGVLRAEVRLPDQAATLDQLGDVMTKMLTEQGLYDKEARAMVKTWRSAWFGEEGTRVLYILPRDYTDRALADADRAEAGDAAARDGRPARRADAGAGEADRRLGGDADAAGRRPGREAEGGVGGAGRPGPLPRRGVGRGRDAIAERPAVMGFYGSDGPMRPIGPILVAGRSSVRYPERRDGSVRNGAPKEQHRDQAPTLGRQFRPPRPQGRRAPLHPRSGPRRRPPSARISWNATPT